MSKTAVHKTVFSNGLHSFWGENVCSFLGAGRKIIYLITARRRYSGIEAHGKEEVRQSGGRLLGANLL